MRFSSSTVIVVAVAPALTAAFVPTASFQTAASRRHSTQVYAHKSSDERQQNLLAPSAAAAAFAAWTLTGQIAFADPSLMETRSSKYRLLRSNMTERSPPSCFRRDTSRLRSTYCALPASSGRRLCDLWLDAPKSHNYCFYHFFCAALQS